MIPQTVSAGGPVSTFFSFCVCASLQSSMQQSFSLFRESSCRLSSHVYVCECERRRDNAHPSTPHFIEATVFHDELLCSGSDSAASLFFGAGGGGGRKREGKGRSFNSSIIFFLLSLLSLQLIRFQSCAKMGGEERAPVMWAIYIDLPAIKVIGDVITIIWERSVSGKKFSGKSAPKNFFSTPLGNRKILSLASHHHGHQSAIIDFHLPILKTERLCQISEEKALLTFFFVAETSQFHRSCYIARDLPCFNARYLLSPPLSPSLFESFIFQWVMRHA